MKRGWNCVLIADTFKPGDPAPEGYLDWHEWARVQLRAGLRQKRCPHCKLWRFPQETCCAEKSSKEK